MTKVYFIRHAEPDYNDLDAVNRALTEKGRGDTYHVANFLKDKEISAVISSPYQRSFDTVATFARQMGMEVETVYDLRERKICDTYIDDFPGFAEAQWADFNYKLETGESLGEVQERNINALKDILNRYEGKNIAIGTHGTALSTIVNYYDSSFGYEDFMKIRRVLPWIVVMTFENSECKGIEQYRLNWEKM